MPDGVWRKDGRVLIELGVDDARWLAGELPQSDGFTRDILTVADEADAWLVERAEYDAKRPRVRIVMVERVPGA